MFLITMILTTMDFMVLGGTVGAVDGAEDPVVGTMDEEEDIEVEGVTMDLMDPMEVVLVDPMEEEVGLVEEVVEEVDLVEVAEAVVEVEEVVEEVDLVEVAEAVVEVEEVEEVVVKRTSMIFLTYSQTLCTCQLTDLNSL
jgi:energy-converting hydrogenase Eha subunit E